MQSQFKKGVIELCVLNELSKEDLYGYVLVKKISVHLDVGESTIYTMLRKLTKENLLSLYEKESPDGPLRKYYQLTDDGQEKLTILLEEWNDFTVNVDKLLKGELDNE
jgi:PadR family transcriptional regulator PadR